MQAALKLNTMILPGHRIEITAPELPESTSVELIVIPDQSAALPKVANPFKDVVEFLDSLTPVRRTPEQWADIERDLQDERAGCQPRSSLATGQYSPLAYHAKHTP